MRQAHGRTLVTMGILLLSFVALYSFLAVRRDVPLYEGQEVSTSRKTGGLFWQVVETEDERERFMKKYPATLPDNDFSKFYLLVSDGRPISNLTYRLISKFWSEDHALIGEADFDARHYPHAMFVYKIKKVSLLQDAT